MIGLRVTCIGCIGFLAGCHSYDSVHHIATISASQIDARSIVQASTTKLYPQQLPTDIHMGMTGDWSWISTATQAVLTDSGYRIDCQDHYHTTDWRTHQLHSGPDGIKEVTWHRDSQHLSVTRNDATDSDEYARQAAALVADAYPMFMLTSAWLLEHGDEMVWLGTETYKNEICDLIHITLEPGLGLSYKDHVIVWIGRESKLPHQLQLSLTGFAPTARAEAVVLVQQWHTDSHGNTWPIYLRENVYKPFYFRVHDWQLQTLNYDNHVIELPMPAN